MTREELKVCIQNCWYLAERKSDVYGRICNVFRNTVEHDLEMTGEEAKNFIYDCLDEMDEED